MPPNARAFSREWSELSAAYLRSRLAAKRRQWQMNIEVKCGGCCCYVDVVVVAGAQEPLAITTVCVSAYIPEQHIRADTNGVSYGQYCGVVYKALVRKRAFAPHRKVSASPVCVCVCVCRVYRLLGICAKSTYGSSQAQAMYQAVCARAECIEEGIKQLQIKLIAIAALQRAVSRMHAYKQYACGAFVWLCGCTFVLVCVCLCICISVGPMFVHKRTHNCSRERRVHLVRGALRW